MLTIWRHFLGASASVSRASLDIKGHHHFRLSIDEAVCLMNSAAGALDADVR